MRLFPLKKPRSRLCSKKCRCPRVANAAIQFSLTTGEPTSSVNLFDAGPYIEDDYRWRPNVTLSAGLRLESQNHISNHVDLAPRLAVAWGIGPGKSSSPKTVLRAGWGMFYDRFTYNLVLQGGAAEMG